MKKCIGVFIGVLLLSSVAGSASAVTYTATYDAGPGGLLKKVGLPLGPGFFQIPSTHWTFDLTDNGFNPATQDVTSATVRLHFSEYDWDFFDAEYAQLDVGNETFNWEVDSGWKLFKIDLSDLSDSGILKFTIAATKGDFWFNRAELSVDADPVATPIPGAAWLLGSGIVGLVGAGRRFQG